MASGKVETSDPITTLSGAAFVGAGIFVGVVAIITGFMVGIIFVEDVATNDPIATTGEHAIVQASVGIVPVAIITTFGTLLADRDVCSDKTIAAAGSEANTTAPVRIVATCIGQADTTVAAVEVAIVAGFKAHVDAATHVASRDHADLVFAAAFCRSAGSFRADGDIISLLSIPSRIEPTGCEAPILVGFVAIVAGLAVHIIFGEVTPLDAITTAGSTAIDACVILDPIGVIAFFHARARDPVTTTSDDALIRATVIVTVVAVIAPLFDGIDDPVAAGGRDTTVAARVRFDRIAIVALFDAGPNDSITATGLVTVVEALILVIIVAVITCFAVLSVPIATLGDLTDGRAVVVVVVVAIVAVFDAGPNDAITTSGRGAAVGTSIR